MDVLFKILVIVVGSLVMGICALIATHMLWLPWVLKNFSEHNFFITAVQEGTAKAIMKYGEFDRFVLSWKGHYLDKDWNVKEFEKGKETADDMHPKSIHSMDRWLPGGLRWVGWPFGNTVYCYHFQWTSIRQGTLRNAVDAGQGTESIVYQGDLKDILDSRDQTPDYIFLKQDVYGQTFQDTEDQDMIPLALIALFTAQVRNPYNALFRTEQWLEQILNFLRSYIKDYVGQRTFAELTGTVEKVEGDAGRKANLSREQSDEILLTYKAPDDTPLRDYILATWGVWIDHLNLVNFKTAGARGEAYEKAAGTEYVEAQKAKGIMRIAEAEAFRVKTVAAAIDEGGENALILRTLEAYETMGQNGANMIIGAGNQPVTMLIETARRPSQVPTPPPPAPNPPTGGKHDPSRRSGRRGN